MEKDSVVTSNRPTLIGTSAPRSDAYAKVMGQLMYATDISLPGMLHGKLLRSVHAHAQIKELDTEAARELPGVHAVLTAKNVELHRYGPIIKDMEVFAKDRVVYVGQVVAAVAAETCELAEKALRAIKIDYLPLRPVLDVEEALKAELDLIHPNWQGFAAPTTLGRQGNCAGNSKIVVGDVEVGFRESYRVFAHRFETSSVHAGYTEPRAAVARWDQVDGGTVWSNTQLPFEIQAALSDIFRIPASKIRVLVPGIGGGFGGKLRIGVEHYALALARAAGRPVRVVSTSDEEIATSHSRQPTIVDIKTGVSRDGHILAKHARIIVNTGAFAGSGPNVASASTQVLAGPYRIPNLLLEGLAVYTNQFPTGSVRAPAGPMSNFAVESQMDIMATELGIDPLEFRLKNIVKNGDHGPSGQLLEAVGLEDCLRAAAKAIGWNTPHPAGEGRAKGLACGWWGTSGGSSGVFVRLTSDGKAVLVSGAVEIGTGALSGAAQVLAEQLGLDVADVSITGADTQFAPFDFGSQGSRTLFAVANACLVAARDLRSRILDLAGIMLGADASQLSLISKSVASSDKAVTLAEVGAYAQKLHGGLIGYGTFISPAVDHDKSRLTNHQAPAWGSPSFHAHAVDLSVDKDTGEVTVHKYVVAQDVGFAINPMLIEGQIEGGVVQGMGQALSEEIVCRDGTVLNANLTDYKMPTALDAPPIETILIQHASALGPYGAKGVGEPPCIEPPAVIANAIARASGRRVRSLPITAEKIASTNLELQ